MEKDTERATFSIGFAVQFKFVVYKIKYLWPTYRRITVEEDSIGFQGTPL